MDIYADFFTPLSNGEFWEPSVEEVTAALLSEPETFIPELFGRLSPNSPYTAFRSPDDWNFHVKAVDLLTSLASLDPVDNALNQYWEQTQRHLVWAQAASSDPNPLPLQMSCIFSTFPQSLYSLRCLFESPNFAVRSEDFAYAKYFVKNNQPGLMAWQKYFDSHQMAKLLNPWENPQIFPPVSPSPEQLSRLKEYYGFWSMVLLIVRICQKSPSNARELVELMIKNWRLVMIFVSLRQGFIVDYGYSHWVQFAPHMRNSYPEYAALFLNECRRHGYNLHSKKKDQGAELAGIVGRTRPHVPEEMARLFSVIFPGLLPAQEDEAPSQPAHYLRGEWIPAIPLGKSVGVRAAM